MRSHMFGCTLWGGTDCQLWRIQRPALESTYRMPVELDPSSIPARMLPYNYTHSYGDILWCSRYQPVLRWWLTFYVWMSLWYVVHLAHTFILFRIPHMPPAGSLKVLRAPACQGGIWRASQTKFYNLETDEFVSNPPFSNKWCCGSNIAPYFQR